jgi:hypothetical protein
MFAPRLRTGHGSRSNRPERGQAPRAGLKIAGDTGPIGMKAERFFYDFDVTCAGDCIGHTANPVASRFSTLMYLPRAVTDAGKLVAQPRHTTFKLPFSAI